MNTELKQEILQTSIDTNKKFLRTSYVSMSILLLLLLFSIFNLYKGYYENNFFHSTMIGAGIAVLFSQYSNIWEVKKDIEMDMEHLNFIKRHQHAEDHYRNEIKKSMENIK